MRVALVAAVAAFAVRLIVLFALPQVPVVGDALFYDQIARQLVGHLPEPPYGGFYRGFGYPLFLAGLYWITTSYVAIRVVQALLWALAIALAVVVAERLFGRRASIAAAALALLQVLALPHFVFLLAENLLVLELLAATAMLVLVVPSRPRLGAVAFGALVGTIALTHIGWQFFPLVALPLLWSKRLVVVGAAGCAAMILVVLGPLHLIYQNQPWYPSSAYTGYGAAWTFYVGTKTETDGLATPADHAAAEQRLHDDAYYWREGLENVADAPLESVALWFRKQWRLFGGSLGGVPTGTPGLDRAVRNAGMVANGLVLLAAVAGLALLVRDREHRLALILAVPALYAAAVFGTFSGVETRYGYAPALSLVVPAALLAGRIGSPLGRVRRRPSASPTNATSVKSSVPREIQTPTSYERGR